MLLGPQPGINPGINPGTCLRSHRRHSGNFPGPTCSVNGAVNVKESEDGGGGKGKGKGEGEGGRTGSSSSSQAEVSTSTSEEKWNGVDIPDVTPPQPTFRPTNSPGPKLIRTATYTVLQLYQLFFLLTPCYRQSFKTPTTMDQLTTQNPPTRGLT